MSQTFTEIEYQPFAGGVNGQSAVQTETVLNNRIEALKELTVAITREVEALVEGQRPQEVRKFSFYMEVRRFEIDLIGRTLKRTGGNQRRAARLLGIKVTTLNSKIKRYRINTEATVDNLVFLETPSHYDHNRA